MPSSKPSTRRKVHPDPRPLAERPLPQDKAGPNGRRPRSVTVNLAESPLAWLHARDPRSWPDVSDEALAGSLPAATGTQCADNTNRQDFSAFTAPDRTHSAVFLVDTATAIAPMLVRDCKTHRGKNAQALQVVLREEVKNTDNWPYPLTRL